MPLIALLSDFGLNDAYVGAMKGVIHSVHVSAQIVDITHSVPAQDIIAGALLLEDAYPYFPNGTIFVAVVDPGVGSSRAAIAVQTERFTFIGPDNGVLALAVNAEILRSPRKTACRALNNLKFHLPAVSATFHGRDIFAPAAAWLARGISFNSIGDPHPSLTPLRVPSPVEHNGHLECHVLRVDGFGNLITNLSRAEYARWNATQQPLWIDVAFPSGAHTLDALHSTYSDVPSGEIVAYFGSTQRLEIARNGRNLAESFGRPRSVLLKKRT